MPGVPEWCRSRALSRPSRSIWRQRRTIGRIDMTRSLVIHERDGARFILEAVTLERRDRPASNRQQKQPSLPKAAWTELAHFPGDQRGTPANRAARAGTSTTNHATKARLRHVPPCESGSNPPNWSQRFCHHRSDRSAPSGESCRPPSADCHQYRSLRS